MAFTDLDEHLAEVFSGVAFNTEDLAHGAFHVIHRKGYGNTRSSPLKIPGAKRERSRWRDWDEERKARTYATNRRYIVKRAMERREAATPATCARPGCGKPLRPSLKPGPPPTTCSRRCSNAAARLRRLGRLPPLP